MYLSYLWYHCWKSLHPDIHIRLTVFVLFFSFYVSIFWVTEVIHPCKKKKKNKNLKQLEELQVNTEIPLAINFSLFLFFSEIATYIGIIYITYNASLYTPYIIHTHFHMCLFIHGVFNVLILSFHLIIHHGPHPMSVLGAITHSV